jgi:hypothetical protein
LNFKQFDVRVVPDGWVGVPQVDDAPHVGPEPHGSARIGLVLPDEDRVWNRKQPDQSSVLKKSQDFCFVRQALVDANLFNLKMEFNLNFVRVHLPTYLSIKIISL